MVTRGAVADAAAAGKLVLVVVFGVDGTDPVDVDVVTFSGFVVTGSVYV